MALRDSRGRGLRFHALKVLLVSSILLLSMMAYTRPARADSTLVQQSSGFCAITGCGAAPMPPISVSLSGPVTPGDLVVVGVVSLGSSLNSVTDSLGSSYTQSTSVCNSVGLALCADIFYSAPSAGGSDAVFVGTGSFNQQAGVYVYEVSGVTASGAAVATGFGSTKSLSTSSSVPFQNGALLLGVIALQSQVTFNAGSGFTASTSEGFVGAYAEVSTGGVSSPTNFPASITSSQAWAEAALALEPSQTTTTSSSTTTTATGSTSTANLQESLGLRDSLTSQIFQTISAPLTDSIGLANSLASMAFPTILSSLADALSFNNQISSSVGQVISAGLTDSIAFSDKVVSTLGHLIRADLNEGLAFGDSISANIISSILPPFVGHLIIEAHSPVDILVTNPQGNLVGCTSGGVPVNQISGATFNGCGSEPETISIPNPVAGSYNVRLFGNSNATPDGAPFTLTLTTVDAGGSTVGTQAVAGSSTPSFTQTLHFFIASDGQVISSPPPLTVPEFTGSLVVLVAVLFISLTFLRGRRRMKSNEHQLG